MEYLDLNKKIKFNKDKNIGAVLYVVEGERREINLLGCIFKEVLGYKEVITRTRSGKEKYVYDSVQEGNENSKIVIINSEESNIKSIKNKEFIEKQVSKIQKYDLEFSYEDCAIYYIFDCDRIQDENDTKELINMFTNAREPSKENEFDSIGGMLLLSYPAIESFIISNFEQDMYLFEQRFDFKEQGLKQYIGEKEYNNCDLSVDTLLNAMRELVKSLKNIDIEKVNLDDMKEVNQEVFEYEIIKDKRYMLSLLLMSFVDLGIIEFE